MLRPSSLLRWLVPCAVAAVVAVVFGACGDPPHRPSGRFLVSWTFVSGRQCGDEGVRITYQPVGTDEPPVEDMFPCRDGAGDPTGRSTPVGLGTYQIEAQLLLANGTPAPGIPVGTASGALQVEGEEIPVTVAIPDRPAAFDATFQVDLGAPGGLQCVGPAQGGLGATRQDVRLIRTVDGECEPVVHGGQDHMGSIIESMTCTTDGLRCVEPSGTQRLEGIPPGRYRLEVDGSREGGPVCWSGAITFDTSDFIRLETALTDPVAGGALRIPSTGACD